MPAFDVISASTGGIFYRNYISGTTHVACSDSEVLCNLFWSEKMKEGEYFESLL
jgi:hypothetical protein